MLKPNFLIIGAAKAGTTSLYAYLKEHPQIYMSPLKETNFFALECEQLLFQGQGDQDYINKLHSWRKDDCNPPQSGGAGLLRFFTFGAR